MCIAQIDQPRCLPPPLPHPPHLHFTSWSVKEHFCALLGKFCHMQQNSVTLIFVAPQRYLGLATLFPCMFKAFILPEVFKRNLNQCD